MVTYVSKVWNRRQRPPTRLAFDDNSTTLMRNSTKHVVYIHLPAIKVVEIEVAKAQHVRRKCCQQGQPKPGASG